MSKNLSGFTETKKKMYTMQLDGHILLNVYHSILRLLRDSRQNASISGQLMDKMSVGINYCAKSKLFRKLKDVENRDFTSIGKVEVSGKTKKFTVHLQ